MELRISNFIDLQINVFNKKNHVPSNCVVTWKKFTVFILLIKNIHENIQKIYMTNSILLLTIIIKVTCILILLQYIIEYCSVHNMFH